MGKSKEHQNYFLIAQETTSTKVRSNKHLAKGIAI